MCNLECYLRYEYESIPEYVIIVSKGMNLVNLKNNLQFNARMSDDVIINKFINNKKLTNSKLFKTFVQINLFIVVMIL